MHDDNQPDETGSRPVTSEEVPKARRALSSLKREVTDEELKSPGAQKLLLELLDRAEEENAGLRSIREKYHQADNQIGVLAGCGKSHTGPVQREDSRACLGTAESLNF